MVNRYSYEFKKFASGKRKGETYCNIRSVKTGKTIKTVSSKKSLQAVKKAVAQQKSRMADEIAWKRVERDVIQRGGTKKQYQKAVKKAKKSHQKAMKVDPTLKKAKRSTIACMAAKRTGITTTIKGFYQIGSSDVAQPYTIGESDADRDIDIEYTSDQRHVSGNNYANNLEVLRNDFEVHLVRAAQNHRTVFYAGYEIKAVDNETGVVLQQETKGGYYPTLAGEGLEPCDGVRKRSKKQSARF